MAGTTTIIVYPDRACITLTFDWPGVSTLRVERRAAIAGSRFTPIRSGLDIDLVAGKATIDDHEAEMDVEVTYRITQISPTTTEAPVLMGPYTLPSSGWSWLKDPALPFRNVRLDEVTNIETETYTSRAGVFDVIDRARPVVVAARRQDRTTELNITTSTNSQRSSMLNLLASGQILLLSTPADYGWGNAYVHVGDVTESRLGLADEPSRRWALPITVVDRPASLSFQPAIMTWSDVVHDFVTWSDVLDDVPTWDDLVQGVPG